MKRCLLYVFTYILMTVAVAFGTVSIDNLINVNTSSGPSEVTVQPETAGDKLLSGLMSIGGAELDLSIELFDNNATNKLESVATSLGGDKLSSADIVILFNGNLNIASLENITAEGNIKLLLAGKEINMFIAFVDNTLFLSNETLSISKKTEDFGELFELLPLLGLDLDLGISLDANSMSSLMMSLQNIKEEKLEDGSVKLSLNLLDIVTLDIFCDKDYNVKNINANNFNIANYTVNLNAGLNKNENIEIKNPQENTEKEYVDITKTLNIVDSVKEIMANKKLHLNLDANILDSSLPLSVKGDVDVDFTSKLKLASDLKLNLGGTEHSLKFGYVGSQIYLDFNGVRFRFDESTIGKTIDVITSKINLDEVEKNILLEIKKIIPNFDLRAILAGNFKDINIDNLLEFSKGEENTVNITIFGNAMGLDYDIKVAIALDENDQFSSLTLSGIKVLNKDVNVVIKYSNQVEIPEYEDSLYPNIDRLPNFISAFIDSATKIKNEKVVMLDLATKLSIQDKELLLNGKLNIDFTNSQNVCVYADLQLSILNKIINMVIIYKNDTIFLTMNNLKFTSKITELDSLLQEIKSVVKDSTISNLFEGINEILYGTTILAEIINGDISAIPSDIIKSWTVDETKAELVINKNLFSFTNDVKISLNYSSEILGISIDEVAFKMLSASLDLSFTKNVIVPTIKEEEYSNLDNITVFIRSMLNTLGKVDKTKTISLNLASSIIHTKQTLDANSIVTKETENKITILDTSKILFNLNNVIKNEDSKITLDAKSLEALINLDINLETKETKFVNGVADNSTTKVTTTPHTLILKVCGGTIYFQVDKLSIKLSIDGANQIIDTICELAGLNVNSNSFANLMEIITSAMQGNVSLEKLELEMIKNISLSNNALDIIADLSDLKYFKDLNEVDLAIKYNENELEKLSISHIKTQNINIDNVDIIFSDYTDIVDYTEAEKNNFVDLSTIGNLLEAINNMTKFTDFNVKGKVSLNLNVIGIKQNFDVPVEAKLSLKTGSLQGQISLGPIPVITGVNNDVPFKTGNVVSGGKPGLDRVLNINIKDNMIYMYRRELIPNISGTPRVYEKKLKVHFETFKTNALDYLLRFGFGLSDKIMTAVENSLNIKRTTPMDLSNILKGYTLLSPLYSLKLNLAELTGNNQLDTFTLGLKVGEYLDDQNKSNPLPIISGITLNMFMPVANNVEITLNSNNLNFIDIGKPCDFTKLDNFVSSYRYDEGASWEAYDSDWYLASQRKVSIVFNTNCEETLPTVTGISGNDYTLPTLKTFVKTDANFQTTYTFMGWYTTNTFETGSEYNEKIMPRNDVELYARWSKSVKKYVYISFVTNTNLLNENTIKVLEGSKIALPTLQNIVEKDSQLNETTKQFENWYLDNNFSTLATNIVPNCDTVLYAKWKIIDKKEMFALNVYHGQDKLFTKYYAKDEKVDLTGSTLCEETTKYYLEPTYQNEITLNKMVANNLDVYVRNQYTATVISNFGNVVNNSIKYYEGEKIDIISQQSYYEEDANVTKRDIFTFDGYFVDNNKIEDISNFTISSKDITIEAKWTKVTKKYFYVSFNMSYFYSPFGTLGGCYVSVPAGIESVKILDGERLDLSTYRPTCKIYNTAIHNKSENYVATTWMDKKPGNFTLGGKGFTSIVVTKDVTLYPVWQLV